MVEKYYFAYGSNLNIFQMMKRVGEWETSKRAYLEGYKLVFNVKSPRWGGYAANIQKTGDTHDKVYGVVYLLRAEKIPVMTSYEGKDPAYVDVKLEEDDQNCDQGGGFYRGVPAVDVVRCVGI